MEGRPLSRKELEELAIRLFTLNEDELDYVTETNETLKDRIKRENRNRREMTRRSVARLKKMQGMAKEDLDEAAPFNRGSMLNFLKKMKRNRSS